MFNKKSIIYAATLSALLLATGCENATRDIDSEIAGTVESPIQTNPEQNETVEMLPPNTGGTIDEDENATVGEIKIDAKNAYRVSVNFSDNYNENGYFHRGEIGEVHFDITNLYTGEPANVDKIEEIVLEAQETVTVTDEDGATRTEGKFFNFITYTGEEGYRYVIPKDSIKASDNVALKVKDLSGTTNIIFSAKIQLQDDKTSTYTLKIPMVIEKNKSSSMAIVPIGSRYENGLYIDKFVIHVVDSYGNKAEDGTRISTGVINNPKLYSNAYNGAVKQNITSTSTVKILESNDKNITWLNYALPQDFTTTQIDDVTLPTNNHGDIINYDLDYNIYTIATSYVTDDNKTIYTTKSAYQYYTSLSGVTYKDDTGTLNGATKTFTLNPANPSDVITGNSDISELDTLIILANKKNHKPAYLGGYDIRSVNSEREISLVSLDDDIDVSGLTYVIGDEYRYIDRGQTLANGAASTFESTEVKDGLAYAELRYTPEMVGKNVFIYANTVLDNRRIGISRNVLLFGTGLSKQTLSCTNEKGLKPNCSRSVRITLNDSGKGAYRVNIGHPQIVGQDTFQYATASQTDAEGWTTVSIYGIEENKTATVEFGSLIFDEYIINQK